MKLPKFTAYPYYYIGAALLALASFSFLFEALDKKGLDPKYTVTQVVGRHYREQSEGTRLRVSSNYVRTAKRIIPEAWSVKVEVDGVPGWAEVSRYEYEKMKEGTEVEVIYARNRIRRALTITTLRLKKRID